jgi:hypothetical protein
MSACWGKPDVIGGASVDDPKADFVLGQEWGAADLLAAMQCDAQGHARERQLPQTMPIA